MSTPLTISSLALALILVLPSFTRAEALEGHECAELSAGVHALDPEVGLVATSKAKRIKKKGKKAKSKKRSRRSSKRPDALVMGASATLRRVNPDVRPEEGRTKVLPPYSLRRIFRGYGKCRRGKHTHQAIDIGGVGKRGGLGTPIFAMGRSKVTLIGLPEEDSRQFGRPDYGPGTVRRGYKGNMVLPKEERLPGYGRVVYFTKDYGSWRAGVVISTKGLEGPLKDHVIRYMHLGAVHPTLKRGTIVEAGEEIGLMGGTAIMDSAPHVHIDITDPQGERVDVARLLGLPQAATPCPKEGQKKRSKKSNKRRSHGH